MKTLKKMLESKTTIRFTDCDPFNHLNNSKYIDYFFNMREDQLLIEYDFDLQKITRERGLAWVVAQNQIAYFAPANLMETVTIQTHLLLCEDKSLLLEAMMWNEDKTILKSVLWSRLVHFNLKTKRSQVHDTDLIDLFKQIEDPLNALLSFDERLTQLRQLAVV